MNSVMPALDFALILILYSSLLTYSGLRPVIGGTLLGFLTGAACYTAIEGFPFIYPQDFPYNAVASMYLFGLFITCLWGWERRLRLLPISLAMTLLLLIVGTTSIKTSLGVLLGAVSTAAVYRRRSLRALRRAALPVMVVGAALIFAAVSSQAVIERVAAGLVRVSTGAEVLTATGKDKDQDASQLGLETRRRRKDEGLAGWVRNPVLGYGVEAFRADIGITSHSTPVDLLYDFGVIGFGLFYSIFASVLLRLFRASKEGRDGPQPLILGGTICYAFVTLSSTMLYNGFLAVFIATSCALLRHERVHVDEAQIGSGDARA